jgi:hypothetical protein
VYSKDGSNTSAVFDDLRHSKDTILIDVEGYKAGSYQVALMDTYKRFDCRAKSIRVRKDSHFIKY